MKGLESKSLVEASFKDFDIPTKVENDELISGDLKVGSKRSASSKAKQKIKDIIREVVDDGDTWNADEDLSDCDVDLKSLEMKEEHESEAKPSKKGKSRKRFAKPGVSLNRSNGRDNLLDKVEKEIGDLHCCDYCNKWFKNKYTLSSHRKRHQFKGHFLCNVCGKGYSSPSCLSRHSIIHTGEKKYECKVILKPAAAF